MAPVWLITGSSNGFGLLLALKALQAGHEVIGTVRSRTKSVDAVAQIEKAGGKIIELDMTESQVAITNKIQDAEKIHGRIDYLVNNAGFSILGPVELFTEKEVTLQYRTNVYGPLFTMQAALPGMRARRSGTIVNLSSVAGQDAQPSSGLYASSKFCLEALSESLYKEVKEFDVNVLLVEPGGFRTNFLKGMMEGEKGVPEEYQGTVVAAVVDKFKTSHGKQAGDPQKAVDAMFEVVVGEGRGKDLKGVFRLALGKDCVERVEKKLDWVRKDLEATREIACSTDIE